MEMNRCPIGVIDSGVGGLTVVNRIRRTTPNEDIIYIGDIKHSPYNDRTEKEIMQYTRQMIHFLAKKSVKAIVLASHIISNLALDELRKEISIPVIGMASGLKTGAEISPRRKIGVLTSARVILHGSYQEEASRLYPGLTVVEQACPLLAKTIEAGNLNGEYIKDLVEEYTMPLIEAGVDTVVYGSTHFPFLKRAFEAVAGERIIFVDPGHETAWEVKTVLEKYALENEHRHQGRIALCFTKDSRRGSQFASMVMNPEAYQAAEISL